MPGINFRQTVGYVTDGTGETYSLGEAYPTTRGGVTFGFASSVTANARDRSNSIDRRMAGIVFQTNAGGSTIDFTIDLPAPGQYDIAIALGDAINAQNQRCQILDNTTVLATLVGATAVGQWMDVAQVIQSSAAGWVINYTTARLTFASTKLVLRLGGHSSGLLSTTISHVAWTAVTAGTLTGAITLDEVLAAGSVSGPGASNLSGAITLDDVLPAGSLGAALASWSVPALTNWGGTVQASVTVPVVTFCRISDGQQVLTLTNQTTNGAGNLSGTSASLIAGTPYMAVGWNADGSQRFARVVTPT